MHHKPALQAGPHQTRRRENQETDEKSKRDKKAVEREPQRHPVVTRERKILGIEIRAVSAETVVTLVDARIDAGRNKHRKTDKQVPDSLKPAQGAGALVSDFVNKQERPVESEHRYGDSRKHAG